MVEKAAKKKPAKSGAAPEAGVLAALPATRPTRLSKRARPSAAKAAPQAAAAKPAKRAGKPAAKRAAAKRKPRAKAKASAATAPPSTAGSVRSITDGPSKPRAVRSASTRLADPARKSAAARAPHRDTPSGTELVTTVVQAAGELAQVGLTVSGQLLKRAVQRLPKP